ncbi:MAG: hypothetical protein ABIP97_14365, partial [Chthoniobacterales bacterium]
MPDFNKRISTPAPNSEESKNFAKSPEPTRSSIPQGKEINNFIQKSRPDGKVGNSDIHTAKFNFTVFVGQYSGGNWNSTARVDKGHVIGGSIPNLLYYLDKVTANRIQGNQQNVRVISLGSEELFTEKPPF